MIQTNCSEGRRLLDAYLIELTNCHAPQRSAAEARETVAAARERLLEARNRYWRHVEGHGCRRSQGQTPVPSRELQWEGRR